MFYASMQRNAWLNYPFKIGDEMAMNGVKVIHGYSCSTTYAKNNG